MHCEVELQVLATPPLNWARKLFRSKAGVKERSERSTEPPSVAESRSPANLRLALMLSRKPWG